MQTLIINPEKCEKVEIETRKGKITTFNFTAEGKRIYCPDWPSAVRLAWDMVKEH